MVETGVGTRIARRGFVPGFFLAFFVLWLSCNGPVEERRAPLVLVLPELSMGEAGELATGFAASAALSIRRAYAGRIRVSSVPEALSALPPDSLESAAYATRVARTCGADALVLTRATAGARKSGLRWCLWWTDTRPDSLVWQKAGEDWSPLLEELASRWGFERKSSSTPIPSTRQLLYAGQRLFNAAGVLVVPLMPRVRKMDELSGWANGEALLRELADLKLKSEDLTDALYRLGKFLTQSWNDTSSFEWKRIRGAYFVYAERWSQAERWLTSAYRVNRLDGRTLYWLSRLHPSRLQAIGIRDWEEALRQAIENDPLLFDARLYLADLYFHEHRLQAARRQVDELLRVNPDHEGGLMLSGRLYITLNDIPNTLKTYKHVLDLNPTNADAYYNLGIVYFHTDRLEDAERLFRRAVEINDYPNAHLYLARIYEKLGRMDEAIAEYRARIRLRKGPKDEFADQARKRLFELLNAQADSLTLSE